MIKPIHKCQIHCHTVDPKQLEIMGLEDDPGKWMPFALHLDTVVACKLAADDEDQVPFGCSTLFTTTGDTYIIDTPYEEFLELFENYYSQDIEEDQQTEL